MARVAPEKYSSIPAIDIFVFEDCSEENICVKNGLLI